MHLSVPEEPKADSTQSCPSKLRQLCFQHSRGPQPRSQWALPALPGAFSNRSGDEPFRRWRNRPYPLSSVGVADTVAGKPATMRGCRPPGGLQLVGTCAPRAHLTALLPRSAVRLRARCSSLSTGIRERIPVCNMKPALTENLSEAQVPVRFRVARPPLAAFSFLPEGGKKAGRQQAASSSPASGRLIAEEQRSDSDSSRA